MVRPDSYQQCGKRVKEGVFLETLQTIRTASPYAFLSCSSGSFLRVQKEVQMISSFGMPSILIHFWLVRSSTSTERPQGQTEVLVARR